MERVQKLFLLSLQFIFLIMGMQAFANAEETIDDFTTTAVEMKLLFTRTLNVSGTFSSYDFSGVDKAFDWTFTTPDGDVYQLQGKPPSDSDLFGWKPVDVKPGSVAWYMIFLGDWDHDNSTKLDWVLVENGGDGVYKLDGVADNGTFKYSKAIDIPFTLSADKKSVTFGDTPEIEGTLSFPETGAVLVQFNEKNGGYMRYIGTESADGPALPIVKAEGKIGELTFTMTYKDGVPIEYSDGNVTMKFKGSDAFEFYVGGELLFDLNDTTTASQSPLLARGAECDELNEKLLELKIILRTFYTVAYDRMKIFNYKVQAIIYTIKKKSATECSQSFDCKEKIRELENLIIEDALAFILFNKNYGSIFGYLVGQINIYKEAVNACENSCPDGGYCPAGAICCEVSGCCPAETTCCGDGCCPAETTCCEKSGICCPTEETCCGDGCCPAGTTCCGDSCCDVGYECVEGECKKSCPDGEKMCGDRCIPSYTICCTESGYDQGCLDGDICCGSGCCPAGEVCLENSICCHQGEVACGGGCCEVGYHCTPDGTACCLDGTTYCPSSGGCCPSGYTCCAEGCC